MDKVYIFGHKNPDTDSVCGSIALCYLKNQLGLNSEPRILSPINEETAYVLKKFKVDVPLYLNDVKVQLKDVNYHKNYIINENSSILESFDYMHANGITGLPLVDDDKILTGYVSLKEIASKMIYNEEISINTTFDNIYNTIDGFDKVKCSDEIVGYTHTANFDDLNIGSEKLDNETILIVGDKDTLIKRAITHKVKLLIVVKDKKLNPTQRALAKKNKVNVIATNKNLFNIARILHLANPIKSIKRDQKTITFNVNDYLTDFNEQTSHLKHTNYPIVNNKNVCLGMLRTIDAHEVNRKKVILIDHNMYDQSIDGLNESEILEIIDHHNLGVNTNQPINFRNMSVGSVNTIIYYLFKESNIKIPPYIAGLMVSGIISDTLLLQSPTTTQKDKLVANELAKIAKLDLKKYGLELLESGVSIENISDLQIVNKDIKIYKVKDNSMAVAQVFTTDFGAFKPRIDGIIQELDKLEENHEYKVVVLFITNFLTNNSYIVYSKNSKKILELAYSIDELTEGYLLKGVVSRKKQIIPNLIDVVEHL